MSLPTASLPPGLLLQLVKEENVIIYNHLAASAFFFWDFCITFSQEVDLIWRAKWGYVTFLFFCSRYLAFAIIIMELLFYANITGLITPTAEGCLTWVKLEIVGGHLLSCAVDILLANRVYAFYGRNKQMLYLLMAIIIVGQSVGIAWIIVVVPKFRAAPLPVPHNLPLGACTVLQADPRFPEYFLPTLVMETILTIIFALKFIHMRLSTNVQLSQLMMIFLRDGLWAYTILFADFLWTYIAYKSSPQKGDTAIAWLFTVLSFSATRLILNLRAESPKREPENVELHHVHSDVVTIGSPTARSFPKFDSAIRSYS